ncbi:hypothetical protein ACFZB4_18485 [Streptomyces pseudovenezuelae]|uniref:hypothetical protein n=1 Tax=Streptomyces pseudovenezuelae TaxID=67350 RepID=UPI0036EE80E8
MRTTTATLATAAALLALTACSSSDDSADEKPSTSATVEAPTTTPTNTPPPADDAELTAAVQAYTAAYFKGDAKAAYGTLSKRCQGKVTPEAYEVVVKQAAADYGTGHAATGVKADVSGELARVSYKVAGLPKFDQEQQPWTREGGDWKYDAC